MANQGQAVYPYGGFPYGQNPPYGPPPPPLVPPGLAPPPPVPLGIGAPPFPPPPPFAGGFGGFPQQGHQNHHLQLTGNRDGILGRFKMQCPREKSRIPDWMKKMCNAIRSARSGLRWKGVVNPAPGLGLLPIAVDEIIPFTVVFTCPSAMALRIPIRNPANGVIMHFAPPADVLNELSAQIYTTVVNLIDYENRTYYQGITRDDGWELIKHLQTCQADEGGQYELLKAQRSALRKACPSLSDYPTFKTACLQLKIDYEQAIRSRLISPDEDWSDKDSKLFVCDVLRPHLGRDLAVWDSDPGNVYCTLKDLFVKASSIYKVEVHQAQESASASSLLHSAEADAVATDMYYHGQDQGQDHGARDQGRGGYHRKGKGKGGYDEDTYRHGTRRSDSWRRQRKGEKGGKGKGAFASMLMPVIAAAVAQATSSYAQWPSASSSTRPPRRPDGYSHNDFRQQKRQRHRSEGVRQYVVTCDGNTEHWDAGGHDCDGDHRDYGCSDTQHNSTPDFASSSSDAFGSQSQ